MTFITNNLEWAASSICDLYRCRWGIEVFFKQIKQTLKVCDFLGHSKQAALGTGFHENLIQMGKIEARQGRGMLVSTPSALAAEGFPRRVGISPTVLLALSSKNSLLTLRIDCAQVDQVWPIRFAN